MIGGRWVPVGIPGSQSDPMDSFQWVATCSNWIQWAPMDFNWFQRNSTDGCQYASGFHLVAIAFNGVQWMPMDLNGFRWVLMDFNRSQ